LEGIQQVVPYEHIRELLGFQKGAPEKVDVPEGMLDGFWNLISGEAHQQRNSIRNPIIQLFYSWMYKRILGRMRETKVTDTKLNWLYSGLIARQPIDPSYLMINRWCCEATSGSRDIGSGCYLSMLVISLRPGIPSPERLLPRTYLGYEYMKQGKYISGDKRGGFKVDKVNLSLPDPRLRLFIQGKEDWLEEGLLVPARKNKRGRIVEEESSSAQEEGAQQNYVPPYGGISTPPSYYRGPPMQAWGSGAAMPPQNYVVSNVTFAEPYAQYPQPQQSVAIIRGCCKTCKTLQPSNPTRLN
jgi:hypothetical protein